MDKQQTTGKPPLSSAAPQAGEIVMRALVPFADSGHSLTPGDVVSVPADTAAEWLRRGLAERVDGPRGAMLL